MALKVFHQCQISPFFTLYIRYPSAVLKFLEDFLKLAFFLLSFDIFYLSYKVFYFSSVNVFIPSLSKIYFQSERKVWFYLGQNFLFFISKTFEFLFRKRSCSLKIAVPEFQKYKNLKLSILAKFLKNKREHELFHTYFSRILLAF